MAEFTVTDVEVAKELPDFTRGPALVYKLTFSDGQSAELFAMASTDPPKAGDKLEGEIEQSQYGPKFKKAGGRGGGGGFKRSPAETKAIQRQHSQEMALMREANLITAGSSPLDDDQLRQVIDWFEGDISGKIVGGVEIGPNPAQQNLDTDGLP